MSEQSTSPTPKSETNLSPRQIIAIVVGVIALIFVFSNTGQVSLNWLFLSFTAPGWVMLLILLAAGFVTGFALARSRYKA
jgi:uncharacterized integral membrane protein